MVTVTEWEAAEDDGTAPAGLLDTYESERRPAGERVVMHSQAQFALSGPGTEVTVLRELFGELLDDPQNVAHIANTMSGADIRYDMGGVDHSLAGSFAPDLTLHTADGTSTPRLRQESKDSTR